MRANMPPFVFLFIATPVETQHAASLHSVVKSLGVRAVAILGPDVSPQYLALFSGPACQIIGHKPGEPLLPADAAIVLGGDGTIHHYLRDLSRLKIPVLMVPRGSGNDFARALGLRDDRDALSAWNHFLATGHSREIDLGIIASLGDLAVSPRLFCNVGGTGLDSEANRRANAMPRWLRGRGGYLLGALGAIRSFPAQRFMVEAQQVSSPDKRIDEPGLMVAFANGPAYGGGLRIAPEADFADGQLDICFVRQVRRARLLRLLPKVFAGQHVALPEVQYFKAVRLRLETEVPLDVYADGEFVCHTPVEVRVVPKALRVIVP
jgi:diacylglycerol kinase (ATP)